MGVVNNCKNCGVTIYDDETINMLCDACEERKGLGSELDELRGKVSELRAMVLRHDLEIEKADHGSLRQRINQLECATATRRLLNEKDCELITTFLWHCLGIAVLGLLAFGGTGILVYMSYKHYSWWDRALENRIEVKRLYDGYDLDGQKITVNRDGFVTDIEEN